ncbi:MAG TPA: hypothetical protein VIS07_23055 [Candidatus Binatia bacterium]
MQRTMPAVLGLVLASALAFGLVPPEARALDTSAATLETMSNDQFLTYARGRFEALQDAAYVAQNLATTFARRCKDPRLGSQESERACSVARAAQERRAKLIAEESELMRRFESRFHPVPSWARAADQKFRRTLLE